MSVEEELRGYLPGRVIEAIRKRGVEKLYPTQLEAIKAGLFDGRSIVVSAPTASGKTLVAVLAIAHSLINRRKVLYLTPLRALASEKYEEFRTFFEPLGYRVAVSTGDYDQADPWLARYDVVVSTNEKADSLLRHRAPWLREIGLVVVDEIHTLGSERRGATLEVLLTRIKAEMGEKTRIVGLSATIKNLEELARWLNAAPVRVNWRPVQLKEGVYYDGQIYFEDTTLKLGYFNDPYLDLFEDTARRGGQLLLFAPTRRSAVAAARRLSRISGKHLSTEEKRRLREAAARLRRLSSDKVTQMLADLVERGVAFHHAGLSPSARRIIEESFRGLMLKAVTATPTLAAGVNLPARRVVIASYRRFNVELGYYERIPVMEYKQMAGRAGRPQYDREGEAVLVARTIEEVDYLFDEYINAEPEKILSQLGSEPVLRSQLLSVISTGGVEDMDMLERFLERTLYAVQFGIFSLRSLASRILSRLSEKGLVVLEDGGGLAATPLGRRTAELYIDPETTIEGIEFFRRTGEASTLAHLLLICHTPDMTTLYLRRNEKERLLEIAKDREGELGYRVPLDEVELEFFLSKLKTALLLEDWIEEGSEDVLVEKYEVGPGDIYAITQTAEWIAFSLSQIADIVGEAGHAARLSVLSKRIKHGVREELLELVSIPGIGRVRARILYRHGYRGLLELAQASVDELAKIRGIGPALAEKIKRYFEGSGEGGGMGEEGDAPLQETIDAFL